MWKVPTNSSWLSTLWHTLVLLGFGGMACSTYSKALSMATDITMYPRAIQEPKSRSWALCRQDSLRSLP